MKKNMGVWVPRKKGRKMYGKLDSGAWNIVLWCDGVAGKEKEGSLGSILVRVIYGVVLVKGELSSME